MVHRVSETDGGRSGPSGQASEMWRHWSDAKQYNYENFLSL